MIIMGTFSSQVLGSHAKLQGGLAAFGVILAAVYMLSLVQKTFFGPLSNPKNEKLLDLSVRETVVIAPLIAMVFVLGLFPNVFLDRIQDSAAGVTNRFLESTREFRQNTDANPDQAVLLPRLGGAISAGYPEDPKKKDEAPQRATALNAEDAQ